MSIYILVDDSKWLAGFVVMFVTLNVCGKFSTFLVSWVPRF